MLRLPSVPTVLALYRYHQPTITIHTYTSYFYIVPYREGDVESKDRILLGTMDGRIGLLILQGNKTLRITWLLNVTGSEVSSLDTYELQDGLDILIGRQDGTVEVYTFPDEDTSPSLRYRYVSTSRICFSVSSSIVVGNSFSVK